MKKEYRYYTCLASGKITKVAVKDIKKGNPIWHIGDTQETFKDAVLFLEKCAQEDLLFYVKQLEEASKTIELDKKLLKLVTKYKKDPKFKAEKV